MNVLIVQEANIEQSKGHKVKDPKTEEQIQFEFENRKHLREVENKEKSDLIRPWLQNLTNLIKENNVEAIQALFIKWATGIGFKNQKVADLIEDKLFIKKNWMTFSKVAYDYYLSFFDDCNKRQRGIKFKRTKYQFEKTPNSNKVYERIIEIDDIIEEFVNSRGLQ